MNAELLRQHEAAKARLARITARPAPPVCRAIPAPVPRRASMPTQPRLADLYALRQADAHVGAYLRHLAGASVQTSTPTLALVIRATAHVSGVSADALLGDRRTADVVRARQIGFYIAHTLTRQSLGQIGRRFGGKDHSTVHHGFRKIERLLPNDKDLADAVAAVVAYIEANWTPLA